MGTVNRLDVKRKKRKEAAVVGTPKPKPKPKPNIQVSSAAINPKQDGQGKVSITPALSIPKNPKGETPTVAARVSRTEDGVSPADRAKAGERETDGSRLAERLAAIAAGVKPGRSKASQIVSGGLSGAAVGAAFDEERARGKRRKKKDEGPSG